MPTRDFDSQRTAALAQLEPISFGLFGREWSCAPMLTPDAFAWVAKVREATGEVDVLHAGLSFVGAVVEDHDAWLDELKGAVIDGDTLVELIAWLADTYTARYPTPEPEEPTITPPKNRATVADLEKVIKTIPARMGRGEIADA